MFAIVTGCCLAAILIYLIFEKRQVKKCHRIVPIRVCVTGTRGKSSITRMITWLLQQEGLPTCGKITGTNARFLLSDGTEEPIVRKRPATILEQKRMLKRAAESGAYAFVSEVMSVTPEYQNAETKRILSPTHLVISNVRADHLSVTGSTLKEIGSVFFRSAPAHTVIVSARETFEKYGSCLPSSNPVVPVDTDHIPFDPGDFSYPEFPENYALAVSCVEAVLKKLSKSESGRSVPIARASDPKTISMKGLKSDFGILRAWKAFGKVFISGFAANDPESTERILQISEQTFRFSRSETIGVCHLRIDKGERSLQWLEEWQRKGIPFRKLFLIGGHAVAVKRRLRNPKVILLRDTTIEQTIKHLSEETGCAVFGFGNIKGFGTRYVEYFASDPAQFPPCAIRIEKERLS
ncbi:MAG TPA: poly-gamma-glutamate synthase PgsB [Thermotogota bacterium]|nr:poly-gamma-glutamate synthase PgsB [Thermotogota bacterium]